MKKTILILLITLFSNSIWSQAPNKMSYQAVVRDADNNLVSNQTIGLKVSILSGAPDGTSVYNETHTINSNVNGLVSIIIGEGNNQSGSFASINWTSNTHYIKTEIDPNGGSNYTITGVQQLLSVPYALHANTADNLGGVEGTEVGEMLYWDGNNWVEIPPGINGTILSMCFGKPTWGNCIKTTVEGPVNETTAVIRGQIFTDGGNSIWRRGICYSTSPNPTIDDFINFTNTSSVGVFDKILVNLTPNTTYYARTYIQNGLGASYGNEVSFTTLDSDANYFPGDYIPEQGGIVFYILQPGDQGYIDGEDHGLIVSLDFVLFNQQGPISSPWGCSDNFLNVTSTTLLSGSENTVSILANCSDDNTAARKASEFSSEGFDDWYLPSIDELNQLFINIDIINGVLSSLGQPLIFNYDQPTYYQTIWSSSEINNYSSWAISASGANLDRNKNVSHRIRPVRTF